MGEDATSRRAAPEAPGPSRLSTIKRVRWFRRDPLGYLTWLRERWGDVVLSRVGPISFVVVCDPEGAARVLTEGDGVYSKRGLVGDLREMLGDGLLSSAGEVWQRHHDVVAPAFSPVAVTRFAADVDAAVDQAITELDAERPDADVSAVCFRLALRSMARALFAVDLDRNTLEEMGAQVSSVAESLLARRSSLLQLPLAVPTFANRRLRAAMRRLRAMTGTCVEEAGGGFARDLADGLGLAWSRLAEREELVDELLTLLIAGHETTATTMAFALEFLAHDPALQERVAAGEDEFVDAVAAETLRLRPPAWFVMRRAECDDVVGGYRVPRGAFMNVCPWIIHRRPDDWPDPERFAPDRFLGSSYLKPRRAYLPFGGGRRHCPGRAFAALELRRALAAILRRFRLTSLGPLSVPLPRATLRPATPIRLRLERR